MIKTKSLRTLREEGRKSAAWRGHILRPFRAFDAETAHTAAFARCRRCGMEVTCCTNPPANGIDIAGEAVALGCPVAKGGENRLHTIARAFDGFEVGPLNTVRYVGKVSRRHMEEK